MVLNNDNSKERSYIIIITIVSLIIRLLYLLQPFRTISTYLYDDSYYYFTNRQKLC